MNESLLQPNGDLLFDHQFSDVYDLLESSPIFQTFHLNQKILTNHTSNNNHHINNSGIYVSNNNNNNNNNNNDLSLPEQLFLLMLEGQHRCRLPPSNVPFFIGFIGIAIGDLMLRGRLAVEKADSKNTINIKVIDVSPTGDGLLDYILEKCDKITKSKRFSNRKTFGGMISYIARGFHVTKKRKITLKIGEQLVEKGILIDGPDSFFTGKTYLWRDVNQKRKLESNCSFLVSPSYDIDNDPIFDESHIKEIILLLILKQYTNCTRHSMVKEFIKRNFKDGGDQKVAIENIKHLESTFKTFNYSSPFHKMIFWILQGIRYSFEERQ